MSHTARHAAPGNMLQFHRRAHDAKRSTTVARDATYIVVAYIAGAAR